jgi:hypothetical protein
MQARVFISQKSQHWMMQMIQSDPNLRAQEMKKQVQQRHQNYQREE